MKRIVLAVVATAALGSAIAQSPSAPEPAVSVRADAGVVQIDSGAAIALDNSAGADAGNTVTVINGKATLTYADGCIVSVVNTHTITPVSPCKAGLMPSTTISVKGDGLLVAGGLGALVLAGLAVGSAGSDRPSSP